MGMSEPSKDLENANDNRPVGHQLATVLAWTNKQAMSMLPLPCNVR